MQKLENKAFPSGEQACARPLKSDALTKEVLETPVPYCLHHDMDLKASTLEVKHCLENGCPSMVLVKEVWAAPCKNEEVAIINRAREMKIF